MRRLASLASEEYGDALAAFELEEAQIRGELRRPAWKTGSPRAGGGCFLPRREFRRLAFRTYYRGRVGYYVVLRRGAERVRLPFA